MTEYRIGDWIVEEYADALYIAQISDIGDDFGHRTLQAFSLFFFKSKAKGYPTKIYQKGYFHTNRVRPATEAEIISCLATQM